MIYFQIPYSTEKDIGKYYNAAMRKLSNDKDYCLFIDGDACFTTTFWGHQIDNIIKKYNNVGLFTACTNRVYCKWQIADGVDVVTNDLAYHRRFGTFISDLYYDSCLDVTDKRPYLSGVLILVQKRLWKAIGGFKENGMLGIDNYLHKDAKSKGFKVMLMQGVYVYHWYRNDKSVNDTSHLK